MNCHPSISSSSQDLSGFTSKGQMKELLDSFYNHASLLSKESKSCRIPTISHHIWLTNIYKPKEMRDDDFNNLNNTINILDSKTESNWQHIFWTNCRSCIPTTVKNLAKLNIEIRELSEYQEQLSSYEVVTRLLNEDGAYGMAADIIREDIVLNWGGFYSDLNYIINRSPENLMERYDFFVDSNVENYMFAASPNHSVLKLVFDTTIDNLLRISNMGDKISGCSLTTLTNSVTYGIFSKVIAKNIAHSNSTYLIISDNDAQAPDNFNNQNCHEEGDITKDGKLLFKCISKKLSQEEESNRIDAIPRLQKCEDNENPLYSELDNLYKEYPWQCFGQAVFGSDGKNGLSWVSNEIIHENEYEYHYKSGKFIIQKCLKDSNSQLNSEDRIDLVQPLPICHPSESNLHNHE